MDDAHPISPEDARIASQALNEVLHGPDAIQDWEFSTRMGTTREQAAETLQRLRAYCKADSDPDV